MAKNGLDKWFKQKWVDIGSKKKDGSFAKCGRSKQKADAKRKYPKCVPLAKATRMSDSQRASAVRRKRAAGNTGPKPTNVKNEHGRSSLRKQDNMPARNKKNFRPTKSGAGMTRAGVAAYRRANPGSKLKTAVTGKVKPGSKAAKRRKSYCARSAGQMKKFPKAAKDPNSRLRQARRRWKC
jgi:hypothetical protein